MQINADWSAFWLSARMWAHLKHMLIVSYAATALYGCAGISDPEIGDEVDLRDVEQYAKRGEADKILGEPDKVEIWEGGQIDVYEIYEETRFFIVLPGPWIPLEAKYSYLTIAYDPDGILVGFPSCAKAVIRGSVRRVTRDCDYSR